jgi:hypothetical protein
MVGTWKLGQHRPFIWAPSGQAGSQTKGQTPGPLDMLGLEKKVLSRTTTYYERRTVPGDQRWEGEKDEETLTQLVIFNIYY